MPRTRKVVVNNSVLFISTSVEEGLMFPPNPLIALILEKCLAQAQALHPVRICHFLFESTHLHMLVVVDNPDDIKGFMERFKTESSHAVNRLLGRKKRTIWCEGYDSPTVLDIDKALDIIAYIYENPAKDGLAETVGKYPGLNSWKYFGTGKTVYSTYYVPRDAIRELPRRELSLEEYRREARLLAQGRKGARFEITPDAWMDVFGVTDARERRELNESIVADVKRREAEHRQRREAEGRGVIGARRLSLEVVGREYRPERSGKRMLCLATERRLREPFIAEVKALVAEGREVLRRWRGGDFGVPYPIGLYAPSQPKRAELLALVPDLVLVGG